MAIVGCGIWLTLSMLRSFAKAFNKLIELGVPTAQFADSTWSLKTLDEQSVAR